jgi:hypothetical protein
LAPAGGGGHPISGANPPPPLDYHSQVTIMLYPGVAPHGSAQLSQFCSSFAHGMALS